MEPQSHISTLKGARNSAAPAGDNVKQQTPAAKPLPATLGPSNAGAPSRPGTRSGARIRTASSTRSSPPSRPLSSQRPERRTLPSSPSPVRGRGKKGRSRAATVVSQITADALASINHSLFTQPKLTAKQLRGRVLKEYLQAHSAGAHKIENLWAAECQSIWQSFRDASYTPLSQEIQRLQDYVQLLESTCQQKLQHAYAVTHCSLSGIQRLVQRIADVGTQIRKDTNVLAEKPGLLLGQAIASERTASGVKAGSAASAAVHEGGNPAHEVCGLDSFLSDPHPPAFYISQVDRDDRERLSKLFNVVLKSIGANSDESRVGGSMSSVSCTLPETSGSLTQPTMVRRPTMPHSRDDADSLPLTAPSSPIPHSTRPPSPKDDADSAEEALQDSSSGDLEAERTQYVRGLHSKLETLGVAFVQLMNRVQVQHKHFKEKIAAQQYVLDAQATRLKLADDVLRDTVAQGLVDSVSAVTAAQQLSLELRERMELSERNLNAALQALIEQSAEVCFDNDVLIEYGSLAIMKENSLCAFLSRTERQAVEQADVLRQAQDGVMKIWQMREKWQLQHSTGETSADGAHLSELEAAASKVEPLPPPYKARLHECDRATLLGFLKRLTMYCPKATSHVIAALDEHEAFCATHPKEAAASREELARAAAVEQLLQKLDEEAQLHCNAHHTSEALSVRIRRLVAQHDAYIDFNQAYARALVRQADAERRQYAPDTVAFFDSRTPVPGQESGVNSGRAPPVQVPSDRRGDSGADASSSAAALNSAAESQNSLPSLPTMPYLKLWTHKQEELRSRQCETEASIGGAGCGTVGRVVGYLEHHPSRLTAPADAAKAAAPSAGVFESAPSSTRSRLRTAISASTSTCVSTSLPHPPVPPRKGLASYVVSTYGSTRKGTEGGAGTASQQQAEYTGEAEKSKAHMPFRAGDHQFIQRVREIFVQQD
ncbi:hypothetical protein GH5_01885 [Leishmania sp. Ghana 2012 LV757]|uniref:hypothetical protein n=1 Tax=Leishmania sp. Ghana 2012 LV757 TaxID=2803181 RepID=UPI001B50EB6C|nr:hypothetical protein GH5_01885 [Leishmania sp. Ghana 2012 LV757]